jgi:hypothetical protein
LHSIATGDGGRDLYDDPLGLDDHQRQNRESKANERTGKAKWGEGFISSSCDDANDFVVLLRALSMRSILCDHARHTNARFSVDTCNELQC